MPAYNYGVENFNKFIISKRTLINNILAIKSRLKTGVLFCACLKANAYSCGAKPIATTIENYVDYFAVNSTSEALEIRSACPAAKIMVLGKTSKENYEICAKNNIDISVCSPTDLKNLKLSSNLNVFLSLNTGMNRYGSNSEKEIKTILKLIKHNKKINLVGAFSHFATGLDNNDNCNKQYNKFCELKKLLPQNIIFSISASGTCYSENFQENMVRVGLNIFAGNAENATNIIKLESKIVHVLKVKKGESISYGCTFVAQKDMLVGIVPLGYADGIPRELSNIGKVIINEKLAPIVGLVCMDCFMVCLDGIKSKEGTSVLVLGSTNKHKISIYDWAKQTGKSPYSLLTNLDYSRCTYAIE